MNIFLSRTNKNQRISEVLYFAIILSYFLIIAGCKYFISERSSVGSVGDKAISKYGEINPYAPEETAQLGLLIGEWDCISKDLVSVAVDSAVWYANSATWKWEYILGGHALINNWWQEDTSPNPITKEYFAAGIFIFNPDTRIWEAVIMNSRPHKISPKFQLRYQDGKLEMNDTTGKWLVTFFDIKKDSFEWKYEILTATGDWQSISKISARRSG